MNRELIRHLWRSPEVRTALQKELLRLFIYVVSGIATVTCVRLLQEKPVAEGVHSASIGMLAVMLAWLISAVRTVRAVLRENGYLER